MILSYLSRTKAQHGREASLREGNMRAIELWWEHELADTIKADVSLWLWAPSGSLD